jgi:hypothetical protein
LTSVRVRVRVRTWKKGKGKGVVGWEAGGDVILLSLCFLLERIVGFLSFGRGMYVISESEQGNSLLE